MNKPFYLPISEVITIIVSFHQSIFRDFKTDYTHFICHHIIVKSHDVVNSTRMLIVNEKCSGSPFFLSDSPTSKTYGQHVR
ncbi:hypothetical protein [Candidatus Enterovibrio escicola]|uniref:hypothetical protein n=1 Tax=Candidatus Enterovibrio escicola TaxID=1927127 RepID=UPI001237F05A|nr:hypothetical protein [Candidatus Enterovibrio escacola]